LGVTYYSSNFHWWAHCKDAPWTAEGEGSARGIGYEGTFFEVSTEIAGSSHLFFDDAPQGTDLGGKYAGIRVAGEVDLVLIGAGVSGTVLVNMDDWSVVLGYETSMDIGVSLDGDFVTSVREGAVAATGYNALGGLVGLAKGLLTPDLGVYAEYLVLDFEACVRE